MRVTKLMKIGKISQSIFNRSVMKVISNKQANELKGTGFDCAFSACNMAMTSAQISLPQDDVAVYAFCDAYNQMVAVGGSPKIVSLSLTLTERQSEAYLKRVVKAFSEILEQAEVIFGACQVEVVGAVMPPIASVTLIGQSGVEMQKARPGMELVFTNYLSHGATAILAQMEQETLKDRFPYYFIKKAVDKRNSILASTEAKIISDEGIEAQAVGKGGVLGALWAFGESIGCGMELNLKSITISQETIEICELFELNPYELYGLGSMVVATTNGEALVEKFAEHSVKASIIGKLTESNDRVILTGEEKRFLEPVKPDELLKMIYKGE